MRSSQLIFSEHDSRAAGLVDGIKAPPRLDLREMRANSGGSPFSPGLPDSSGGGSGVLNMKPSGGLDSIDQNVLIILVLLLLALISAVILNCIVRCILRSRSDGRVARVGHPPQAAGDHSMRGLDAKTLASLPVFTFKVGLELADQSEKTAAKELPTIAARATAAADCTICLSEFAENERLRLLPNCNHVYHLDCIDMWLLSHVSCPVCRDAIGDDPNFHSIVLDSTGDYDDPSERAATQDSSVDLDNSNLLAQLLRDHSSRRTSIEESIARPSTPRRRSMRSTLSSMFAASSSSPLAAATSTTTTTS